MAVFRFLPFLTNKKKYIPVQIKGMWRRFWATVIPQTNIKLFKGTFCQGI